MSDTLRQSMTYGIMPSWEDFETAFNTECPHGAYNIRLGSLDSRAMDGFKLGDGEWSARELYDACVEIHDAWSTGDESTDAAMDLVSSVMDTLGFEWI